MLRGLRRRLDRLWEAYEREKAARLAEGDRRGSLREFVLSVRAGLRRAGIDPATVRATAIFEPGSIFGRVMQPPQPPPSPAESPVEKLRQRLLAIVERHREQPLDLAKANLMELFALYCFIPDRPGISYIGPDTA
jgi:hypothetical protein